MTAQPVQPESPSTGSYEVIHLGDSAAVVVPMQDFLRLRALEQQATAQELEHAEDLAAVQQWQTREANGQTSYLPADQVRTQLGIEH